METCQPQSIETTPKPKGRAEERIRDLSRRNRTQKEEIQQLTRQLEEVLELNQKLTNRLLQLTGGR